MGFHDYPPRLDTANLPHIPVYRWRILMKTMLAEDIRCRSGQKPNILLQTLLEGQISVASKQGKKRYLAKLGLGMAMSVG